MAKLKILDVDVTVPKFVPVNTKVCNQAFRIERKKRICTWERFSGHRSDAREKFFRKALRSRKYIARSMCGHRFLPIWQSQYLGQ